MPKYVFLLSDSLGETVTRVARAATTQFDKNEEIVLSNHFNIQDTHRIDEVIAEARQVDCCLMYTMVEKELHRHLCNAITEAGLPGYDIMEPALSMISHLLGHEPSYRPGLTHQLDASYFERIEAIEFAVKYDDGKFPQGFLLADIILLGVSRTSKTPLSMYLANRGYKVANLPLIGGTVIPPEIEQAPRERIIGLSIDAEILIQVRQERLRDLHLPADAIYAQRSHIENELLQAQQLFERLGCKVIDVSYKAIEETASRVIAHISASKPI
ncbi:MAG: kinase/pyrophosphorylase [Symbiobacteriaceae bacterium]|nr:kinase/pyrophosphorylase [Symbiobacteriaceae bacterium]